MEILQFQVFWILSTFAFLLLNFSSIYADSTTLDDTASTSLLYDMSFDPYETENLYFNETYAEMLAFLQNRSVHWQNLARTPEVANTTEKLSTWKSQGGIVPWVTSEFEELDIKTKFSPLNPPHIVFVFVDDWGWNDVGYRSSYLNWTTPTIDSLADQGVRLSNYHTHETCSPSRGALMTGRYPLRLGMWQQHLDAELPLDEITLAQELQSAGYMTYMIGKWHLGMSTIQHYPTRRGFDYFYGYMSGQIDYWNKTYGKHLDLQDHESLVTKADELDGNLHNAYLLQQKVEKVIEKHGSRFSSYPMFLYYALQLIHGDWTAPTTYTDRCQTPVIDDEEIQGIELQYCGMNLMLDEIVANLTCSLAQNGLDSNTVMIIASDNGGEPTISGNSFPFKGSKGSYFRGGVSANVIIHSDLIPVASRNTTFAGLMHVTDWLPTLMYLATEGEWLQSYGGVDLDGVNLWPSIVSGAENPRHEVVFYADSNSTAIQYDNVKFFEGIISPTVGEVNFVFSHDQDSSMRSQSCAYPSLLLQSLGDEVLPKKSSSNWTTSALLVAILAIFCGGVLFVVKFRKAQHHPTLTGKECESSDNQVIYGVVSETSPLIHSP